MPEHFAEKPYPTPLGSGVAARAELARSAETWRADIEAYLVERQLTTDLADSVIRLMDFAGWSLEFTVDELQLILREYGE